MIEVVVVGSAGIDLVTYVQNFPKSGETIIGNSFEQKFGGKGANQAVILSRLGTKCGFCAMIGEDSYGDLYMNQLINEGVNINGILKTNLVPTGVACITVANGGANMIIINPGANYSLHKDHIQYTLTSLFQSAKVLVCQNEIPPESTLFALQLGKQLGMLTIFNPAPISSNRELLWNSILEADIICPNETEIYELLNHEFSVETIEDIQIATQNLHQRGVKIIIVTLGSRGAFLSTNLFHELIPAPIVENCIDTVGAGDCFVGTLAHHLSHGSNLHNAIEKSIQCASISVTRKGAQESYPTSAELISLGIVNNEDYDKSNIRQLHGLI